MIPSPERRGVDDEISTQEAASALGCSVRTIRRAIKRGELSAVKRGTTYVIAADDLMHFAARGRPHVPAIARSRLVAFPSSPHVTSSPPRPLSSFVGRAADIAAIVALVERPAVRLLTLTGPGGIGKTRLALAAAAAARQHFADGVVFVDLAPIARPALVVPTICQALQLREIPGRDRRAQLHAFLSGKRLLLVLDNLERLLAAAPEIAELAVNAPGVTLLVTSRAPLRVAGERELPVAPLPLPPAGSPVSASSLLTADGARLFIARAQAHDPGFRVTAESAPLIADICARLDGLPLAIELAAARVKVLPLRRLRDRLERRLPLLTGGARNGPERHRTMRDAIAWSYDLLSTEEQRLFRCLAVFAGGCTLEAADYVGGEGGKTSYLPPIPLSPSVLDLLASLVDQSLLVREIGLDGEPRFRMLETIREFGLDQLAPDEQEVFRTAHARYFLRLAQALRRWISAQASSAPFLRLAADEANLRAAHDWLAERGPAADFAAIVAASYRYWYISGHLREPAAWIEQALANRGAVTAADRARLFVGRAAIFVAQGEAARAEAACAEALPGSRAVGDPLDLALALIIRGAALRHEGRHAEGEAHLADALAVAETIEDPRLQAAMAGRALANLGLAARAQGDLALAATRSEEALRRYRGHGLDVAETRALMDLAGITKDQGNHRLAAERYLACIAKTGEQGETRLVADALARIVSAATAWGQHRPALLLFGAASAFHERMGTAMVFPSDVARVSQDLAALRAILGDAEAETILAEGRALSFAEAVTVATRVVPARDATLAASGSARVALTRREQDVLRLLAAGQTDREIADALFIGLRTVSWHVSAILGKLGVTTRREAVDRARTVGLI